MFQWKLAVFDVYFEWWLPHKQNFREEEILFQNLSFKNTWVDFFFFPEMNSVIKSGT